MAYTKVMTTTLLLVTTTALAGCLGSGTGKAGAGAGAGGGGTDTGGASAFEANYDAAAAKIPTSDMPSSIQADYVGQFKAGLASGSGDTGTGIGFNTEIVGDMNIAVDWTDGQSTNPFSGTASNIAILDVVTNEGETLTGELTVDPEVGNIALTRVPSMNVNGVQTPEAVTGAYGFLMEGELGGSGGDVEASLLAGGAFFGAGGESMVGTVSGTVREVGGSDPTVADAAIGGVMYMNRE